MRARRSRMLPISRVSLPHLLGMDTNSELQALRLEPLLDVSELASYLGVPVSTIYDWRTRGTGPRAHRFGKHLKFTLSDVQAWVAEQRDDEPSSTEPEVSK